MSYLFLKRQSQQKNISVVIFSIRSDFLWIPTALKCDFKIYWVCRWNRFQGFWTWMHCDYFFLSLTKLQGTSAPSKALLKKWIWLATALYTAWLSLREMNNNCFVSRASQSNMRFEENNKQNLGLAPASESSVRSNEHWMSYKVNVMLTFCTWNENISPANIFQNDFWKRCLALIDSTLFSIHYRNCYLSTWFFVDILL